MEEEDQYLENAIKTMRAVIGRKIAEVEELTSNNGDADLINYLNQDISSYITVLNGITGEDEGLEKPEFDEAQANEYDLTGDFTKYLDELSPNDLESEYEADDIRCEYFEELMDLLSFEVGIDILGSKKIIKALAKNDTAVMAIGEIIINNDELYELYEKISSEETKNKKKKKKSKS
jgi:hypothetical protein